MKKKKIRYAVAGLGWIVQESVLPAFARTDNAELTALISDDEYKLEELGDRYKVRGRYSYDEYEKCLQSGEVDAVYIGLPNALHCEYVLRAAKAGIHILCEKPLAMSEGECLKMMKAASAHRVRLMVAYRLHFEQGNLKAIDLARSGRLGDVRIFHSTFGMNVASGNVRWDSRMTGGTLNDMGIYCINAARGIFQAEPLEVTAFMTKGSSKGVEEMLSGIMRFPQGRLASFTSSFGTADNSAYELIGTKGSLRVDPAFHHRGEVKHLMNRDGRQQESVFPARQQFAAEIVYFSKCLLTGKAPEPSGQEGRADVRIIEALYKSARTGRSVSLPPLLKKERPSLRQSIRRRDTPKPSLVRATSPSL